MPAQAPRIPSGISKYRSNVLSGDALKKTPRALRQRGKLACRYLFQHAFQERPAVLVSFNNRNPAAFGRAVK